MKFRINDLDWLITERFDERIEKIGKGVWGFTSAEHGIIALRSTLPSSRKRNILMHELTHAFIFSYLITHLATEPSKDYTEEELCNFVASYGARIVKIANEYFKKCHP